MGYGLKGGGLVSPWSLPRVGSEYGGCTVRSYFQQGGLRKAPKSRGRSWIDRQVEKPSAVLEIGEQLAVQGKGLSGGGEQNGPPSPTRASRDLILWPIWATSGGDSPHAAPSPDPAT